MIRRTLAAALTFVALHFSGCTREDGPARVAFLAGGSGEESADNFFVQDLRNLRARLRARGWRVGAAVGARAGLLPGSSPATNHNILEGVRRALGSAREGDQVLVLLHSHGREREKYWGQRSHSIVSEDKAPGGNDAGFDLDTLDTLFEDARKRGVRAALVDLTCYSGNTQALPSPSCTVTLAAARYVSLCSGRPDERLFTSHFFDLPRAGMPVDLETQFLKARARDLESVNFPQISSRETPAREAFEAMLESVDPLDAFGDLRELRTGAPVFDPAVLRAAAREALDRARAEGRVSAQDARELERRLADAAGELVSVRRRIEEAIPALAKDYDGNRVEFKADGRGELSLAIADLHGLMEFLSRKASRLSPGTHAQRQLASALEPRREELEKRFRFRLNEFASRRDEMDRLSDRLARQAGIVLSLERRLYETASAPVPGASACREFQL